MRKILLLALMLLIVVVPSLAQETLPDFIQHTECEQDLTGETVTIYHIGDVSGSYAPITQPLLAGLSDAIAYYNARGGVCGANLASENFDTGGDPAQTQAGYDQFSGMEEKPDVLILYASGDSELLRTQLAEDEIPVLISAGSMAGLYGENADEPGWIFATNPLYADQFASFCDFVASSVIWAGAARSPRLGWQHLPLNPPLTANQRVWRWSIPQKLSCLSLPMCPPMSRTW
jgi:branched-chain amino acid transport system substrate-binding protein